MWISPPERSGLITSASKKVISRFSWKETYLHQPTPPVPAGIPSSLVLTGRRFTDPPPGPRRPPRPTSRPLLGGVLLPPAAPKSEPSPGQRWAPACSPGAPRVRVRGRATGSLPRRRGPRVPAPSAGETLRVVPPEPAGAAGLQGGDDRGEMRPPQLHRVRRLPSDSRRRGSGVRVDPGKKSRARLGPRIRPNRIQCPAPAPRRPLAVRVKAGVPAPPPAPPPAARPRLLPPGTSSPGLPRARGGGAGARGGRRAERNPGARRRGLKWGRRGSKRGGGAL